MFVLIFINKTMKDRDGILALGRLIVKRRFLRE